MTTQPTRVDQEIGGVRRGYVLVGALLLGIATLSASNYHLGHPIWRRPAERQALLYAGHEDPRRFGETAGGERAPLAQRTAADAVAAPSVNIPYWSDPDQSMRSFFDALAHSDERLVRAAFYGTSEIGFDRVTSQMRRRLQDRFGDGGKGFVVIAPGWRYQRHRDVEWRFADTWDVYSVRAGRRPDGRYGLGGVLAVNNKGPAWVEYQTTRVAQNGGYHPFVAGTRWSRLELFYQATPGGGAVTVEIDGNQHQVTTEAAQPTDRVLALELADGPHHATISTDDRPAHLYGVALERSTGILLDALMIIGAWSHTHLSFDASHLEQQIALRSPDLVIFQLGAKEVFRNPNLTGEEAREFAHAYTQSVRRTLAGRPKTACLIISMKDMGVRVRNRILTRAAVPKIVAASEEAARATGCAFYNIFEAMGGEGTMERWSEQEPRLVSPDLGHLMRPGAIAVGDMITDALLAAYAAHRSARELP